MKQYSMDVGSDPQLNNMNMGASDMWEKIREVNKLQHKPDQSISRSQPSLKDTKGGPLEGNAGGSLDSKESATTCDRLPAKDRIKHKLLRSRSSGAKYSRFRDKYKQSKAGQQNNSEISLSKEKLKKSNQTGSNETGSDMEDSVLSDWGSEEAACDLEVKMITGGTEDEEDDIRPTLSPYASEDRDSGHIGTSARGLLNSAATSGSQSTSRGDSTPRAMKPPHLKCRSPMPPPLASAHINPGIDNTSFELGEDVRLPPCCKAREAAAVRRSSSFSPSKLTPKAFSPPMILSPRSDRSLSPFGFREHTTAVSPLALEDSAYKLSLPQSGRDLPVSPIPFAHAHMLTVPNPHALYSSQHLRSPSPTPSRQAHLALPIDCSLDSRWQPVGSPTPIRRQQTLTRSSAVDNDYPGVTSPLRRRIPHTLSMDSAFLAPPGLPPSFSINEPFVELHAGCRAASPLPSPRNSQQTLPSMFTRSASPSFPQLQHLPHLCQQQSLASPSSSCTPQEITITEGSQDTAGSTLSVSNPSPSDNCTDSLPSTNEEKSENPASMPSHDEMSGQGGLQQQRDDNSDQSEEKL